MGKNIFWSVSEPITSWWLKIGSPKRMLWRIIISIIASFGSIQFHEALKFLHNTKIEYFLIVVTTIASIIFFSLFMTNAAENKRRMLEMLKKRDEANEKLQRLANIDPLTELYNERYIERARNRLVRHAIRNNESLFCTIIDIDYFKKINDTYGHPAGDEILKIIAGRLLDNFHTDDIVFRKGGDEFMILTSTMKPEKIKHQLVEKLEPFEAILDGISIQISLSYGCSFTTVEDHIQNKADLEAYAQKAYCKIYAEADMEMYEMKANRPNKQSQETMK